MPAKREGETPKKVYSIRLEEKDFEMIVKKYGSLGNWIKAMVKRENKNDSKKETK